MSELNAEYYIHILTAWLEDRGYDVFFEKDGDNSIDGKNKIVEVNSKDSLEYQLIVLLHECGHSLIYKNSPDKFYLNRHTSSYKTAKYRTCTLLEEVEAWNRAESLMKRLKIKISEDLWEKEKILSLGRYIKWAAKGE